jgi:hypothetical protein
VVQARWFATAELRDYNKMKLPFTDGIAGKVAIRSDQSISNSVIIGRKMIMINTCFVLSMPCKEMIT